MMENQFKIGDVVCLKSDISKHNKFTVSYVKDSEIQCAYWSVLTNKIESTPVLKSDMLIKMQ